MFGAQLYELYEWQYEYVNIDLRRLLYDHYHDYMVISRQHEAESRDYALHLRMTMITDFGPYSRC